MLKDLIGEQTAKELTDNHIAVLKPEAYDSIRATAEIVESTDTFVAGDIVILRLLPSGQILVKENPDDKPDIIVRPMPSLEEAREFVEFRLAHYERMWDGCSVGKVKYYAPFTRQIDMSLLSKTESSDADASGS